MSVARGHVDTEELWDVIIRALADFPSGACESVFIIFMRKQEEWRRKS